MCCDSRRSYHGYIIITYTIRQLCTNNYVGTGAGGHIRKSGKFPMGWFLVWASLAIYVYFDKTIYFILVFSMIITVNVIKSNCWSI